MNHRPFVRFSLPVLVLLTGILSACSPDDTNPRTPVIGNLTASPQSQTVIALTWTPAQTPANGGGVTAYSLERKTGAGAFAVVATPRFDATNYSDAARTAGTTYMYRLRAQNAFGFSGYSNEATATTNP